MEKSVCDFFALSCIENGGVYRFRLYENGKADIVYKSEFDRPMYFTEDNRILHTVLRAPFADCKDSAYLALDSLTGSRVSECISTEGEVGCHICVVNQDIYLANYISGSIVKLGKKKVQLKGHSVNPVRQTTSHAHSVFSSPDGRYILCADLGADKIIVFDRELNTVSECQAPLGSGPRHLALSKDGTYVYCITEMSASVLAYSFVNGALTYKSALNLLENNTELGSGAAIKLSSSGDMLYITERKSQRVYTVRVRNEELDIISYTDCMGVEPRDISLLGNEKYALVSNQFSNSIAVFRITGKGELSYISSISLPAPVALAEAKSY